MIGFSSTGYRTEPSLHTGRPNANKESRLKGKPSEGSQPKTDRAAYPMFLWASLGKNIKWEPREKQRQLFSEAHCHFK